MRKPCSIETGNAAGGDDLAAFWAEVLGVLYDEDLKLILKRCPQPRCPRCAAVRAEMGRRKRRKI